MKVAKTLVRVGAAIALRASAAAAVDPGETALQAIFQDPAHGALPLSPATAAVTPESEVRAALGRLEERYGKLQSVEPNGPAYIVRLSAADLTVSVSFDATQQISSLRVTAVVPRTMTLTNFATALAALPGQLSVLVTRDGQELYARNADVTLAVGSAFKLVVLRAVMDAIASGRLTWRDIVELDPARRSIPTGFLQTWPAGTPVTIATLANAMISVSDNTAADTLEGLVGEDALDKISPRNAPFLSTRTMATLRSGAAGEPPRDWRSLDAQARSPLVARAAGLPLPDPASLQPVGAGGAEWYISARELCALLAETREAPAFRINPGPASREEWRSIAFKGGGDDGVLDLSVLGVSLDGHAVCVTATWNDPHPALEKLAAPVGGLLHALAHGSEGDPPP